MKVFISWSGERSQLVADFLEEWIQCVIQAVDPWMSSKDIDRGALWFSEIADQLATTTVGIICLTKENKNKPWILFESGALAKGLSSNRVCTFLVDLESTDLENPLAQFNHTKPDRNGVWQLVKTINATLKEASLKEPILNKVFATYWPQFETKFNEIISNTPDSTVIEERDEADIMNEVLSTVRALDKRMRNVEKVSEFTSSGISYSEKRKGEIKIPTFANAPVTNTAKLLRAEGLTKEEARVKLQQSGFNPTVIDRVLLRVYNDK